MNRSILMCVIVLALAPSVVVAQPAPAQVEPADQAYQRGRAHYDLREWDQAIAEFKEAYRLRPDAPSLFNIAQSYRLKGDCAQAASFYKTYRRNFPNESNIARVDQFITEMDACAKTAPVTPPDAGPSGPSTSPPTGAQPPASGAAVTPPAVFQPSDRDDSGRTLTMSGWIVGGVGVACVIGGVVAGLRASSIEDDVQQLPVWDPSLHDKGENADLLAKILISVGGAAVITGGTMLWIGHGKTNRTPSTAVRFVPRADGGLVFVTGAL